MPNMKIQASAYRDAHGKNDVMEWNVNSGQEVGEEKERKQKKATLIF